MKRDIELGLRFKRVGEEGITRLGFHTKIG